MEEVKKLRAQRQVADALNIRNSLDTSLLQGLPLNSEVLVYREGNGEQTSLQTRPYRFLGIDNQTIIVNLLYRETPFQSTLIKPYLQDKAHNALFDQIDAIKARTGSYEALVTTDIALETTPTPQKRGRGRPRKHLARANLVDSDANIIVYLQEEGLG